MDFNIIVILGPTASGKTNFATQLAYSIDAEIISADSRQVYRGMDIGTGKDLSEYTINGQQIPYHLLDIRDPGYKYSLFEFQKDFVKAYNSITAKGKTPLLVGGTGLYLESVLDNYELVDVPANDDLRAELSKRHLSDLVKMLTGLNPDMHNTTDTTNKKRTIRAIEIAIYSKDHPTKTLSLPELNPLIIGVSIDREERRKRISNRLQVRLEEGMIEEVEELLKSVSKEDLLFYGLEYKFITQYLIGELSYDQMFAKLEVAIHQFAKRQMTWFRKMEKKGHQIYWIDQGVPNTEKVELVKKLLGKSKAL